MIRSFGNRALKRYFEAGDLSGVCMANVVRVGRMLQVRDVATRPEDVNLRTFTGIRFKAKRALRSGLPGIGGSPSRGMAPSPSIWRITVVIEPRTGTGLRAMHPSELLREEILPSLDRSHAEVAHLLGVSRQAPHAVLSERASLTPEMALRLGQALR